MFTISNSELSNAAPLYSEIKCRDCGKPHKVMCGKEETKDGSLIDSDLLQYYVCNETGKYYLAGINWKRVGKE